MKIQADTTFWLVVAAVIGFGIWFGHIEQKLAAVEKRVSDYYTAVSMARAKCESSYESSDRALSRLESVLESIEEWRDNFLDEYDYIMHDVNKRLDSLEIDIVGVKEAIDMVECEIWSLSGSRYNDYWHRACSETR